MSYIYGCRYTITVKLTEIEELMRWLEAHLPSGELSLTLSYGPTPEAANRIFGEATVPVENARPLQEVVSFTNYFWLTGSLHLILYWYVGEWTDLGVVNVRYPILTVRITDEDGSPIPRAEVRIDHNYASTDENGEARFEIIDVFTSYRAYARKEKYDDYPYWTYIGLIPPLKDVGDYSIAGTMRYTGVTPPPPAIAEVKVRVYERDTYRLIDGANVYLNSASGVTVNGTCILKVYGGRAYTLRVSKLGYEEYSTVIEVPEGGMEVGVALTPRPAEVVSVELKLEVDRTEVNLGEEITFKCSLMVNGSPYLERITLFEDGVEIYSYIGDFIYKHKPKAGTHRYHAEAVISGVKYVSNELTVEVKAPTIIPPAVKEAVKEISSRPYLLLIPIAGIVLLTLKKLKGKREKA